MDVVDALDLGIVLQRHVVEAEVSPMSAKDGRARPGTAWWCAGGSSRRGRGVVMPCPSPARRTSRSSLPPRLAARFWLSTGERIDVVRLMPYLVAIRSALMPCGTKWLAWRWPDRSAQAPPSEPSARGSSIPRRRRSPCRLRPTSPWPRPCCTASRPRSRRSGSPAHRRRSRRSRPSARRCGRCRCPARRSAITQPSTTSSTCDVSRSLRSRSARSTCVASSTGVTSCSEPVASCPCRAACARGRRCRRLACVFLRLILFAPFSVSQRVLAKAGPI